MHIFLLNGCTKRLSETIDASFFSLSLTSKRLLNICTTTAGQNDAQKQNTMWIQLNDSLAWCHGFASWRSRVFRLKILYEWICSINTVQFAMPSWCFFNTFSPPLQRVVKADIVNYSQDTMARTVNPPRSSMCALQWTPPPHASTLKDVKLSLVSIPWLFFLAGGRGDRCKSVFSVFLCVGKMKNRLCGFKATLCSWAVHQKSNRTSVFF